MFTFGARDRVASTRFCHSRIRASSVSRLRVCSRTWTKHIQAAATSRLKQQCCKSCRFDRGTLKPDNTSEYRSVPPGKVIYYSITYTATHACRIHWKHALATDAGASCRPIHLRLDPVTFVTTSSLAPSDFKLAVESDIQFSSCVEGGCHTVGDQILVFLSACNKPDAFVATGDLLKTAFLLMEHAVLRSCFPLSSYVMRVLQILPVCSCPASLFCYMSKIQ